MNDGTSSPKQLTSDWKNLFIAALFEPDKTRLAQRIAEAQAAIAARRQELLAAANDAEEKRVLDNAAFSLLALAQCFSMSQVIAHRGVEHRSAV